MYMDGSKFVMSASGDLTIRQVKSTDSAEYICRVYNTAGEGYSDYLYVDLTVNSKSSFSQRPDLITLVFGAWHILIFLCKRLCIDCQLLAMFHAFLILSS